MARVGFEATKEQKAWIENKSRTTKESEATIMRQLVQKEVEREKSKK